MDGSLFDSVMKTLATTPLTRGQTLRGLSAGMVTSLPGLRLVAEEAGTKPGGRKKRRRKRPQTRQDRCGCGPGKLCDGGECLPCDVCADGCAYDTIAAAIADAAGPATIHVCPGTWPVPDSLVIDRDRTIVGAGSRPDGAVLGEAASGTVLVGAASGGASAVIRVVDHRLELRNMAASHVILDAGALILVAAALAALPYLLVSTNTAIFGEGSSFDPYSGLEVQALVAGNTATITHGGGGILNQGQVTLLPGSEVRGTA